ncbi:hypothetical protein S83_065539 [Arachis hypogaea]
MKYLDLTGINLQEETNWLQLVTLLPSLSELYLEYYGVRDIYPSLQYANFTTLDVLDLSNNDFVPAKLPHWIFNFRSEPCVIQKSFLVMRFEEDKIILIMFWNSIWKALRWPQWKLCGHHRCDA